MSDHQIKDLVAKGKLSKALLKVLSMVKGKEEFSDLEDIVLINKGQLEELEMQEMQNAITPDALNAGKNKIAKTILQLAKKLEEAGDSSIPSEDGRKSTYDPEQLKSLVMGQDKVFIGIIFFFMIVFSVVFLFGIISEKYVVGGGGFSGTAATYLVYLNNKRQMLKLLGVSI